MRVQKRSTRKLGLLARFNRFMQQQLWLMDLGLLGLRGLLAYLFFQAGYAQFLQFEETVFWFDEILHIPQARWAVVWVIGVQLVGAASLLLGFCTRLMAVPLLILLGVAIYKVHWIKGWSFLASASDPQIVDRLQQIMNILEQHADLAYLLSEGSLAIVQGGMEHMLGYLIMLLLVFAGGAGRISLDGLSGLSGR